MVSVRSTVDDSVVGAGTCPLVGGFAAALGAGLAAVLASGVLAGLVAGAFTGLAALAGVGTDFFAAAAGAAGLALLAADLTALLEMTNRRRSEGFAALAAWGLAPRGGGVAALGTEALRFNINYSTKKVCAGSE